MTAEKLFQKIISNLGRSSSETIMDIYDYGNQYKSDPINDRDINGLSLLTHAIQMNDGGCISYLLRNGADMNTPCKEGSKTTYYDYAKEYATFGGREPYAFNALESFKSVQEKLKIEILFDQTLDTNEEVKQAWYDAAKNKKDDELVSFFHGAKLDINSENGIESFKNMLASNSIKEFCGPTIY